MPKVVLTILYSKDWKEMADITVPAAQRYCDKHGYRLVTVEYGKWYSNSGFDKLELIKELFQKDEADIVFSLDADCLLTNHNVKVEDFVSDAQDLFICKDYNGHNAGSFLVRNSAFGLYLLDYLLGQRGKPGMHCEQNAIEAYSEEFGEENIGVLPHPSINSYLYQYYPDIPPQTHEQGQWQDGDFVLHLPGIGYQQRIDILKQTKIVE